MDAQLSPPLNQICNVDTCVATDIHLYLDFVPSYDRATAS